MKYIYCLPAWTTTTWCHAEIGSRFKVHRQTEEGSLPHTAIDSEYWGIYKNSRTHVTNLQIDARYIILILTNMKSFVEFASLRLAVVVVGSKSQRLYLCMFGQVLTSHLSAGAFALVRPRSCTATTAWTFTIVCPVQPHLNIAKTNWGEISAYFAEWLARMHCMRAQNIHLVQSLTAGQPLMADTSATDKFTARLYSFT